jgi:hypothetical protein
MKNSTQEQSQQAEGLAELDALAHRLTVLEAAHAALVEAVLPRLHRLEQQQPHQQQGGHSEP